MNREASLAQGSIYVSRKYAYVSRYVFVSFWFILYPLIVLRGINDVSNMKLRDQHPFLLNPQPGGALIC